MSGIHHPDSTSLPDFESPDRLRLMRMLLSESSHRYRLTLTGCSMYPRFKPGDSVELEQCSRIRYGDIIVYRGRSSRSLIVHRVIRLRRWRGRLQVRAKGDNSSRLDRWVDVGVVIGRVRTVHRGRCIYDRSRFSHRSLGIILAVRSQIETNARHVIRWFRARPIRWPRKRKEDHGSSQSLL
jgi:signal peptidase I